MEIEESYQEAERLFEALACMKPCDDKITMCETLIERFGALGAYEDSIKNVKKCRKLIQQTKDQQVEDAYQDAVKHKDEAKIIPDYEKAEKEFELLKEYKDSAELKEQCQKAQKALEKKLFLQVNLKIVFAVFIVAVLVMLQFPLGKYYSANALMKIHLYDQAAKTYSELGKYKDCKARWKECEYQYGKYLKRKGKYPDALRCFQNAGSTKNSTEMAVQTQKIILRTKKTGGKIKIGDCNWIILSKEENQVLLIKKEPIKKKAFAFDRSNVTWENSNARSYLNSEYLSKHLSMKEAGNIIPYHSQGNVPYTYDDKLVLLSQEEAELYKKKYLLGERDHWLRTKALDTDKMMFLSSIGDVMTDGYPSDATEIGLRPLFWYSLE